MYQKYHYCITFYDIQTIMKQVRTIYTINLQDASKSVKMTDKTMAKGKRTKGQTTIFKILHIKQKID